ncbi:MAG: hypothetical protein M1833_003433 [Piccolia ochrophora]|nr:MAG: hypothetical protein M1833_003433 [Piccolia ochrophora]
MSLFSKDFDDPISRAQAKHALIEDILGQDDLYRILGASRTSSPLDLRRCYLERSKICHPDKPPFHASSTSAFQKLGLAFAILKTPSTRRTYDASLPHAPPNLVSSVLDGDIARLDQSLSSLRAKYPHLVSPSAVSIFKGLLLRVRFLALELRSNAQLLRIEFARVRRAQVRLSSLPYTAMRARARLTLQLARVTLAVPVRMDRALKRKAELRLRGRNAGSTPPDIAQQQECAQAGFLNKRFRGLLEAVVGDAGQDEEADRAWEARIGGTQRAR